jgi:hypothetical protein
MAYINKRQKRHTINRVVKGNELSKSAANSVTTSLSLFFLSVSAGRPLSLSANKISAVEICSSGPKVSSNTLNKLNQHIAHGHTEVSDASG